MIRIEGQPVTLYETTETGKDEFGTAIYTESPATVENVLIAPATEQEVIDTLSLYGKKVVYKLGIPKGDAHDWSAGNRVDFWGEHFRTIGNPTKGIEAMIPLEWHQIVRVERIENETGN